jgi:hypothetical protein
MELKKKDLLEIIDTNGELIGSKNIPEVDPNADTQAHGTTDTNAKIGTQPFRYDMLGRFGFTLMPFMEGEDKQQGQAELENDLVDLMNQRYVDLLSHYYRNPDDVKSDYRKYSKEGEVSAEAMKYSVEWADKILKVIEKHFDEQFKNLDEQFKENIAESKVAEDKMVDKKEDEISNKSEDGEIKEKKLEKIAGLINKLEKKDIDKLINLLEKKNG